MSKSPTKPSPAQEYDFSGGVRGKYAQRHAEGTNIVLLEPDVQGYFPDSRAVNEALRLLVRGLRLASDAGPGGVSPKV